MSKYIFILFFIFFQACTVNVPQNDASIGFVNEKHDFGTIPLKKEATYSFGFTNPGKTMLIIKDVKTSCGCTVPEWSREPIRRGKKGLIEIKYDAASPGMFHKTIEVFYNGPGSPAILEITGKVGYPDENIKQSAL